MNNSKSAGQGVLMVHATDENGNKLYLVDGRPKALFEDMLLGEEPYMVPVPKGKEIKEKF